MVISKKIKCRDVGGMLVDIYCSQVVLMLVWMMRLKELSMGHTMADISQYIYLPSRRGIPLSITREGPRVLSARLEKMSRTLEPPNQQP